MTFYRLLLLLYPRRFRDRYGGAMLQALAAGARAARSTGPARVVRFHVASLRDVLWNACAERAGWPGPRLTRGDPSPLRCAGLAQDVRFAFRMLWRRPALAFFTIATVALAIAAVTAIGSLADAVLLRPLALPEPHRLVAVRGLVDGRTTGLSYDNILNLRDRSRTLAAVSPFFAQSVNLTGTDEPVRLRGAFVTSDFFPVTGIWPDVGRAFGREADRPGAPRLVVLTDAIWRRRFGAARGVVGRTLVLNNSTFTVAGVMPPRFEFPLDEAEVLLPFWTMPSDLPRDAHNFLAVARLTRHASLAEADAEVRATAARLEQEFPDANRGRAAFVRPFKDVVTAGATAPLGLLLAMACVMLAAAAANVAGLQLGATAARRGEVALRAALGAGRARITRQLVIENVVRSLAGGVLGLLAGRGALGLLLATAPDGVYGVESAALTTPAIAAALAAALITGLLAGLPPALHWTRRTSLSSIRAARGTSGPAVRPRLRTILVVSQVAVATVLLVVAGLLARSFVRLTHVDPGFDPDRILTMEYRIPANKYASGEVQTAFHRQVLDRVRAIPGVEDAAGVRALPFSGNGSTVTFRVSGRGELDQAWLNTVSDRYFTTMRIQVVAGRAFDPVERHPVIVVSRALAERTWPGQDPLGREVSFDEVGITATVVGVVADVRHRDLTDGGAGAIYASLGQNPGIFNTLAVRTAGPPLALADAVRRAVWDVDPNQPVWKIRRLDALVDRSLASRRLLLQVVLFFGGSAGLLAVVAVYGVVATDASQRRREIGVRIALGATRAAIARTIVWRGARLSVIGIAGGLAMAAIAGQLVGRFLFGVEAHDPVTFAAAAIGLVAATLTAALLPARQALRVDPAVALREG